MWNTARTESQIMIYKDSTLKKSYSTSLIGNWNFNESTGQYIADSSITNNQTGVLGKHSYPELNYDPLRSGSTGQFQKIILFTLLTTQIS